MQSRAWSRAVAGAVLASAALAFCASAGQVGANLPSARIVIPQVGRPEALKAGAAGKSSRRTLGKAPGTGRVTPNCPPAFVVELLTPAIETIIGMPPAEYPVEDTLKLRVTSTQPGWSVSVSADDLKEGHRTEIRAREIYARIGVNLQPLNRTQTVVQCGAGGVTTVEIPLALVTNKAHDAGVYTGMIRVQAEAPCGQQSPCPMEIPFTVTVGCRVSYTINGHKMYFHFGDLRENPSLTGTITGALSSDALTHMTLSVAAGRIDQLPLIKRFPDGDTPTGVSIPLQWKFREVTCGTFRTADTQSCNGRDATWTVHGTPGAIDYQLECIVQPATTQMPGDYAMPLELTIVPVL